MNRRHIIVAIVAASIEIRPVEASTSIGNPVGRSLLEGCNAYHAPARGTEPVRR